MDATVTHFESDPLFSAPDYPEGPMWRVEWVEDGERRSLLFADEEAATAFAASR